MKVGFVIRDSGRVKGGGDVDLARLYSKMVNEQKLIDGRSIDSTICSVSDFKPLDYNFVVLFNIDLAFDGYLTAKKCLAANVPYAIYTLHPKMKYINLFLRRGTHGIQYAAAALSFFRFTLFENLATINRLHREKKLAQLPALRPMRWMARYVLENSECAVVSCEREARQLEVDYFDRVRHTTIPHYFDPSQLKPSEEGHLVDIEPFVLCAARVEPRKNQMAVVKLAKIFPRIKFLFIGSKNLNHPKYIELFDREVDRADNMTWRDQVSLEDLKRLMRQASVYISLSWFEVFSLVDLMAIAAGTPALMSLGSYIPDDSTFSGKIDLVSFVDPSDLAEAGALLEKAFAAKDAERKAVVIEWSRELVTARWLELFEASLAGRSETTSVGFRDHRSF